MQKQRLVLIAIGAVLALAAVYLTKVYLDQQRQIAREEAQRETAKLQANQTAVVVAAQDIPRGTVIAPETLETKIFPNQYVAPQAVTSLDRIAGMVTIAPIPKGEQITLSKLATGRRAGGLAEVTPVGKRAITIKVDNIAALAGMIKPGDYVDLIVLLPVPVLGPDGKQIIQVATIPLLQNVLVLAVGQETGAPSRVEGRYEKGGKKETGEGEISSLITVALAPQEANLLVFIQEQGKIRLTMRSPADSQISQMQMVTPNNLALFLQHVLPKEATPPEEKAEVQPTSYVEIYRGLKREKVPLSQ